VARLIEINAELFGYLAQTNINTNIIIPYNDVVSDNNDLKMNSIKKYYNHFEASSSTFSTNLFTSLQEQVTSNFVLH